jgi:hypothetical protein
VAASTSGATSGVNQPATCMGAAAAMRPYMPLPSQTGRPRRLSVRCRTPGSITYQRRYNHPFSAMTPRFEWPVMP